VIPRVGKPVSELGLVVGVPVERVVVLGLEVEGMPYHFAVVRGQTSTNVDIQAAGRRCMVDEVGLTYVLRNLTVIGGPQSPIVLVDLSLLDKPGGTETTRSAVEMTFAKVKGRVDYKIKGIEETLFVVEAPVA
jgi:hypothetical protein